MFDSPVTFEPLLNSEQAAALMKVHPKTLQRYARSGLVAGLRLGKLWRFRASDLRDCVFVPKRIGIDSEAEPRYSNHNHSCPQPDRR